MKAAIFDTYVRKRDSTLMHFDIVVQEGTSLSQVLAHGKNYLAGKGQEGQKITSEECRLCHLEEVSPAVEEAIQNQGYHVIEMQGC